ncbi:MAG: FAD-binding oxidoreductase [Alphaproteobacteria bacterium]|nr:FAD-binding oxidoreductase [Alphaproteobacteria bacterium]
MYDAIVVGAGITGASIAYHLKARGAQKVLIIERNTVASGGTGASAAAVRQNYSSRLMTRLARRAIEKFRVMADELGMDGGFEDCGYHMIIPADMVEGLKRNIAVQRELGVVTEFMTPAQIAERCPWLNMDGVAAVTWEREGGCADPVKSTEAYVHGFKRLGGEVRLKTPVRRLLRAGERIVGVETDQDRLAARWVVNAAGPFSTFLAASAVIPLPMRSVREQDTVWEARPNRPLPIPVLAVAIDGIYIRRLTGRRYVIGRGFPKEYVDCDPYNFKVTADQEFINDVMTRAENRIPSFAGAKLIDAYASYYDVTPDWHPFLGPRRDVQGYCDASGGSGHGFKFGPSFGESVAQWLLTGDVDSDFKALSYDRIPDSKPLGQTFGGNRG